jgi:predicted ArsR family transcriptional regulator
MEVTATAVRQRLARLLGENAIQREVVCYGRGRPRGLYRLTEEGLRRTDSPFTAAALVFWEESRQLNDPELRRDTLRRIARASGYADQIQGKTPVERKKSLAKLLKQQQIPAPPEAPAKPSSRITLEQLKAVSQMIKAIGGFDRLREMLAVIKEVGGVTKLKDWLDTMEVDEPDDGKP